MIKKIVLYGATGKVAWPILNEALARGHQVTAVTRGPGQARFPSHGNLTVEQGDILIGVRDMVGTRTSSQVYAPGDIAQPQGC